MPMSGPGAVAARSTVDTPPGSTDPALEPPADYLTFSMAGETYAIDIQTVREIRQSEATTPLAGAPDWVVGVMNLRGAILPIVDLRRLIGIAETASTHRVVIIVALRHALVGLLVDQVDDVIALSRSAVGPVPPVMAREARHVRGIALINSRPLLLLDPLALLDEKTLPVAEAV